MKYKLSQEQTAITITLRTDTLQADGNTATTNQLHWRLLDWPLRSTTVSFPRKHAWEQESQPGSLAAWQLVQHTVTRITTNWYQLLHYVRFINCQCLDKYYLNLFVQSLHGMLWQDAWLREVEGAFATISANCYLWSALVMNQELQRTASVQESISRTSCKGWCIDQIMMDMDSWCSTTKFGIPQSWCLHEFHCRCTKGRNTTFKISTESAGFRFIRNWLHFQFLTWRSKSITTIFMYALKWSLLHKIDRHKAQWVVCGVMELSDVHFDPASLIHLWHLMHIFWF